MENTMPDETLFDAIVVGAGPSGSSTALFLAKEGRKVLLLDKASFPREKVCGDAFSGKSIGVMRELGLLSWIEKHPHGIVRGVRMVSPNGKAISVPFPNADGMDFAGYTIARINTDNIIFQSASANPNIKTITGFQVQGLIRDPKGAICGVEGVRADGKREQFKSRIVVGADGAASAVSRIAGLPNQPIEHVYSAIRVYWNGVEGLTEDIELYFIDGVLPGYLWVFPMGGRRANVGLGILSSDMKARKHPNIMLQEALAKHPMLSGRFKNATQDGKIGGWSIPLGSYRKKSVGEGWLLVGDAASLVDPFSGEGMGNALSSGKFAAQTINEALSSVQGIGPLPEKSLSNYPKLVDSNLRPEMENSYKLQKLSRSRFLLNLFIGKAATKPEARQMVINMLASDEAKKKVESPLFFLKLLLP